MKTFEREFEAILGYHETQVRAAFKARYSKAVEEIVKDIAPTDFRCLFVSTKGNFSVRTNQRGSNMQGGTRTVAGAVAGTHTQMGSSLLPKEPFFRLVLPHNNRLIIAYATNSYCERDYVTGCFCLYWFFLKYRAG